MRTLRILFAKELNATLTSPIGYTVAAVFLLVLGYTFSLTLFATKVANLQYIFHQMYVLSILLVPVLTMRTFAEERRSETLELLLTAPVREVSIVLAKYAATLTLVLCDLRRHRWSMRSILDRYGEPDWGPIYAGYLALSLHASLLVAVGLLMSSLTENQVVAAALSIGTFLMLWFADSVSYLLPPPFDSVAINLSLIGHFKPMVSGLGVPVGYRLFRHREHAGAVSHGLGARAAMSVRIDRYRLVRRRHRSRWCCCLRPGLRLPVQLGCGEPHHSPPPSSSLRRLPSRSSPTSRCFATTRYLDLTREKAFTPSVEARRHA